MDPNKEQSNTGAVPPANPTPPQPPVSPAGPPAGMPDASAPDPVTPGAPGSPPANGMEPPKNAKKSMMILLIVVAAAIVLAVASYFLFANKNDRDNANKAAQNSTEDVDATALDTLNNLTMNSPADMKDFKDTEVASTTAKQLINEEESCVLQFGTLTAEALPGDDLGDIVARQIESIKDNGGTLEGPDSGEALLLKDAEDDSVTYSMPTLVFSYSKDKNRAKQYYSAVVLKNGDRAFVSRICGNSESKEIPQSDLDEVNELAKGVTVTKK